MTSVTLKMKDGTVREFPAARRAGGSFSKRVLYEGVFVIIEDEWHTRTAIPAGDVREVIEKQDHY